MMRSQKRWKLALATLVAALLVCLLTLAGGYVLLSDRAPSSGQPGSGLDTRDAADSQLSEPSEGSDQIPDSVEPSGSSDSDIENEVANAPDTSMQALPPVAGSGPDFDPDEDHDLGPDELAAIGLAAANPEVAAFLQGYSDWHGHVYLEEGQDGVFYVEFYSDNVDEWLGYALVDLQAGALLEHFVPRDLTTAEFAAGQAQVRDLVFGDGEVLAILGDSSDWGHEIEFNRWERAWEVYFWRGLDEIIVSVYLDEEGSWLEIWDPSTLTAEQARELSRNQAIEIAYQADGVGEALEGHDDWTTYVEHLGDDRWSVSFIAGDDVLFFAAVDISTGRVLESQ